jgi:hypothetical protein
MATAGIIGVPCREQGRWSPFWQCLDRIDRPAGWRLEVQCNNSVAYARNIIAKKALDEGADYVFWLDDDLLFAADVLTSMLARRVEILIGLSMMRARRDTPGCSYKPLWSNTPLDYTSGYPVWHPVSEITRAPNGLMPLTSGTGGGVLMQTSVFRDVPPLWWTMGQIRGDLYFEDIGFYQRCLEAGIAIWGDPDVKFGHIHPVAIWPHEDPSGWSTIIADGFEGFIRQPWPSLVTA